MLTLRIHNENEMHFFEVSEIFVEGNFTAGVVSDIMNVEKCWYFLPDDHEGTPIAPGSRVNVLVNGNLINKFYVVQNV